MNNLSRKDFFKITLAGFVALIIPKNLQKINPETFNRISSNGYLSLLDNNKQEIPGFDQKPIMLEHYTRIPTTNFTALSRNTTINYIGVYDNNHKLFYTAPITVGAYSVPAGDEVTVRPVVFSLDEE